MQDGLFASHDWSVLTHYARTAPLVMHLHISKTGGTTLRMQGAGALRRRDCGWNLRDGQLSIATANAKQVNCSYISIEAPVLRLPWSFGGAEWPTRGFTVTMVRNPVEQWLSVVRHTYREFDSIAAGRSGQVASERQHLASAARAILSFQNDTSLIGSYQGHDPRNMQTRWLGPSLPSALSRLSDSRMLVLVNEFYDASICLMAVVADNWPAFRSHCRCGGSHVSKNLNEKTSADHIKGVGIQQRSPIDGLEHSDIGMLTNFLADDFILYGRAMRIFLDDVRAAEAHVKQRFLCNRNAIADEMYERWNKRPKAFDEPPERPWMTHGMPAPSMKGQRNETKS